MLLRADIEQKSLSCSTFANHTISSSRPRLDLEFHEMFSLTPTKSPRMTVRGDKKWNPPFLWHTRSLALT